MIKGLAALLMLAAGPVAADCSDIAVSLRGAWGSADFSIELADTVEERALGLMHRTNLPRSHAMLFVYDKPQRVAFWMRNTLIPLDMLYIDAEGVVQEIHTAIPLDETPIPSSSDMLAVLEINGGQAAEMGITPGTQLQHSAFGPKAVWPCEEK